MRGGGARAKKLDLKRRLVDLVEEMREQRREGSGEEVLATMDRFSGIAMLGRLSSAVKGSIERELPGERYPSATNRGLRVMASLRETQRNQQSLISLT